MSRREIPFSAELLSFLYDLGLKSFSEECAIGGTNIIMFSHHPWHGVMCHWIMNEYSSHNKAPLSWNGSYFFRRKE